jgi:predicted PurR-regulated permease PerM
MDWSWRFVIVAVTAWLLTLVAISVRRVRIGLIPALVFMIVCSPHFKTLLKRTCGRTKLMIVVVSVFVGVGTMIVVAETSALSDFIAITKESRLSTLVFQILSYRLTEFGGLFVNVPTSKTPKEIHFMVSWLGVIPSSTHTARLSYETKENWSNRSVSGMLHGNVRTTIRDSGCR